jgi:addiction module RelE/StbE family toxin
MALADREAIMDFVAIDNPVAAIALDDQFEAKAEQARLRPTLYKPGRMKGTREIVVRPNYVMVYAVSDEAQELVMLRVLHAAQQWP